MLGAEASGVFSIQDWGDGNSAFSGNTDHTKKITFNANSVVPTSPENRPVNISFLPLISY